MPPSTIIAGLRPRPRFTDYGWSGGPRLLTTRRLARMCREIDPELRQLVFLCVDRDWSDPGALSDRLRALLAHRGSLRRRFCKRWLGIYDRLSHVEQWTLVDAHLNRRGLPEAWLFRVGVADICFAWGVPIPSWPVPRWPLNGCRLDRFGGTPLHHAMTSEPWMTELLLQWGAKPDVCDAEGRTVLHVAAAAHGLDHVSLLLAHRARSDTRDRLGQTPLDVALRHENYFAALTLLRAGASTEGLERHLPALRALARSMGDRQSEALVDRLAMDCALAAVPAPAALPRRRL